MQERTPTSPRWFRWFMAAAIALIMTVPTFIYYRWVYEDTRRLRVVTTGKLYRSGRMTANGMEKTIKRYGIKTVINLMDEDTAPRMPASYFNRAKVEESELCERLGARFIFLKTDLVSRFHADSERPKAISEFLEIMRNPDNHPVLLHCRAGLHRTGVLTAVYRMEMEGWSATRAWEELRANGFGDNNSYVDNDYIRQYVFSPLVGANPSHAEPAPAASPTSLKAPCCEP
jgi:protein tyrosine/serine phosphatase